MSLVSGTVVLGLSITTPQSSSRGFGYIWRDRLWVGPFKSEHEALKAAFDEAIQVMNTERPYIQSNDGVWWKWENGWQYLGKLEPERENEAQA